MKRIAVPAAPIPFLLGMFFACIGESSAAALPRGLPPPDDPLYQMRDPFSRPRQSVEESVPRTELELIPLERFRLLGISTGPKRPKALLQAEGGKTYFVTENLKIGTAGGVIRKILPKKVVVSEKSVNELGQEQNVEREIALPDERGTGTR